MGLDRIGSEPIQLMFMLVLRRARVEPKAVGQ